MPSQRRYIIDFDSTFIRKEGLEELAKIALKGRDDRAAVMTEIEKLTDAGIDGRISFTDGLRKRIKLIRPHRDHLEPLIKRLRRLVSPSVRRNREFFKLHREEILIVSAGFRAFIEPIVARFGIPPEQVFANDFRFDKDGFITGFNSRNPLSQPDGKKLWLQEADLPGELFVIGDGYSDYVMKKTGKKVKFYAFTENVARESAMRAADHVAPNMEEFLFTNQLPMAHSYPKNRIKVLLLENIHPDAEAYFETEGYSVQRLSGAASESELRKAIKGVHVLGIRSKTQVTRKVLESADRLICVGAFCIGTNQIDLDACLEKGIAVFNAPFSNTRSVVELVIGLIIMLERAIPDKDKGLHEGSWLKSASGSREIRGKTLGIVGYGNIGSQLSVLAEGLGMRVVFFDKADKLALGNAQRLDSLKKLLKQSDIVTLHVDGDPANKDLFGADEFKAMKKGSVFLNLSRGFVVDVEALGKNIRSGRIRGAAVDVFPYEPKSNDEAFETPLQGLPNVILTPHIGGSTEEAQMDIARFVPDKIVNYVNTGNTMVSVNFPNIQLPEQKDAHRLIHIHRNEPGVMAKINAVYAHHEINILGQHLKTNESIGYVITDIDKEYKKKVIDDLKDIPGTIKFRVLY